MINDKTWIKQENLDFWSLAQQTRVENCRSSTLTLRDERRKWESKQSQRQRQRACVGALFVSLTACVSYVMAFVWDSAAVHPTRNQEPDPNSPDLLRVVECDRKHTHTRTHIHTRTHRCMHKPKRNRATGHTLPQASREEGSKGWWSQSTPTVNLSVTQVSAFQPCNLQNE